VAINTLVEVRESEYALQRILPACERGSHHGIDAGLLGDLVWMCIGGMVAIAFLVLALLVRGGLQ
jgi:hypothetical protein